MGPNPHEHRSVDRLRKESLEMEYGYSLNQPPILVRGFYLRKHPDANEEQEYQRAVHNCMVAALDLQKAKEALDASDPRRQT